ncbi:hypothetical protein SLS62_004296 [Diatrype stigma]|uniref:Uncharacterized protein n=1 Tax=Diatrype stigma TaxID=117547 RepID=A0AAN9V384_9PEZI
MTSQPTASAIPDSFNSLGLPNNYQKRFQGGSIRQEGDSDDEEKEQPKKKAKISKDSDPSLKLACPYYQRNPGGAHIKQSYYVKDTSLLELVGELDMYYQGEIERRLPERLQSNLAGNCEMLPAAIREGMTRTVMDMHKDIVESFRQRLMGREDVPETELAATDSEETPAPSNRDNAVNMFLGYLEQSRPINSSNAGDLIPDLGDAAWWLPHGSYPGMEGSNSIGFAPRWAPMGNNNVLVIEQPTEGNPGTEIARESQQENTDAAEAVVSDGEWSMVPSA